MKLLNNLKGLITEIAAISDITDAVKNKKVITIYYNGKDNGGKGYRTIEPVCLGFSKKNNLVLRAWERFNIPQKQMVNFLAFIFQIIVI